MVTSRDKTIRNPLCAHTNQNFGKTDCGIIFLDNQSFKKMLVSIEVKHAHALTVLSQEVVALPTLPPSLQIVISSESRYFSCKIDNLLDYFSIYLQQ